MVCAHAMAACSTTRRNSSERSESIGVWERRLRVHLCSVRWQLAARRPIDPIAEQVIRLHHLVDFARALVDDGALAVAVETADRILVRVPVGAVDLHGVAGGALRCDG